MVWVKSNFRIWGGAQRLHLRCLPATCPANYAGCADGGGELGRDQTLRENWLYARILLQLNIELVEKWATPTFLLVIDINQHIFSQSSKRT